MQPTPPIISSTQLQDIEEEEYFEVDSGTEAQVQGSVPTNDVTFVDGVPPTHIPLRIRTPPVVQPLQTLQSTQGRSGSNSNSDNGGPRGDIVMGVGASPAAHMVAPRNNSPTEISRPVVTIPNYSLDIPDPLHPDTMSRISTVESPPLKQESIDDLGLLPPLPTSSEFDLVANLNRASFSVPSQQQGQQVQQYQQFPQAKTVAVPSTVITNDSDNNNIITTNTNNIKLMVPPPLEVQLLPDPLETHESDSVIMHNVNDTAMMKDGNGVPADLNEASKRKTSAGYSADNDIGLTKMKIDTNVTGLNTAFDLSKALEMTPSTPLSPDHGLMLSMASPPTNTPATVPNTSDRIVTSVQSKPRRSIGVSSPVISQLSSKFNIQTKSTPVSGVKRSSSLTHSYNSSRKYSYSSYAHDHGDKVSAMPRKFSFEGCLNGGSSGSSSSSSNRKRSYHAAVNSKDTVPSLNPDILGVGTAIFSGGNTNTNAAATTANTPLTGLAIPSMFPLASSAEHSPEDSVPKRAPFLRRVSSSLLRRTSLKSERRRSEEAQMHVNPHIFTPSEVSISPNLVTNTQQALGQTAIGQFSPPPSRHGSLVKRSASLGSKVKTGIGRILSNGSSAVKRFTSTPASTGATGNTTIGSSATNNAPVTSDVLNSTSTGPMSAYATPRTTATETFGSPFSFTSSIAPSPPNDSVKKTTKNVSRGPHTQSVISGASNTINAQQQRQQVTKQGLGRSGSLPRTRSKIHHRHSSSNEIELDLKLLDSSEKFPEIFVTDSLKNEPIEKIIEQSKLSLLPTTRQERRYSCSHSHTHSRKSTSTTSSSTPSIGRDTRGNSTIGATTTSNKLHDRIDDIITLSNAAKANPATVAANISTTATTTTTPTTSSAGPVVTATAATPPDPEGTEKLSIKEYTILLKKLKTKDIQKYDIIIQNFKKSGWCSPHDIKVISEKKAKLSKLWNDKIAFYQNLM